MTDTELLDWLADNEIMDIDGDIHAEACYFAEKSGEDDVSQASYRLALRAMIERAAKDSGKG